MVQTQSQASGKNANCVEEGTCFIAGTLIQTADGACAIEEIEEGMLVYAADPESGELGLRRVVNTFKKTTNELIHVSVNGEEIVTTPTHPFWRPKHGWTKAVELRAGDILLTSNGEYVVVEQVQHEILEAPVEVYNFEVEDFHTYYVGVSSVLVHNKCDATFVPEKYWTRNASKVGICMKYFIIKTALLVDLKVRLNMMLNFWMQQINIINGIQNLIVMGFMNI